MLRRAIWRLARRAMWLGGTVLLGRWAWRSMVNALSPEHRNEAMYAGVELTSAKRRVLVIAPQKGDAERLVGGTLKLLAQGGSRVAMAILTPDDAVVADGADGEPTKTSDPLGLGAVIYQLDLPEGGVRPKLVFDALKELIKQEKPDCIMAFDPAGLGAHVNPDLSAAATAIQDMVHTGLLDNIRLYYYATRKPNVLVDVASVSRDDTNTTPDQPSRNAGISSAVPTIVQTIGRFTGAPAAAAHIETLSRII